jgi:23S rRNA (pseudouridine1915-N3)-methyltransferase
MAVKGLARVFCSTALPRAVRPIPIKIVHVGKSSSRGPEDFSKEWAEKLRRYTQVTEIQIKPNPSNAKDPTVAKALEGERVLKSIAAGERLVVLDERGKDVTSNDVAELLATASDEGWPAIVFAIGGPYGHDTMVRDRAHIVIRLSSLVLNHTVARVVLLEQLYRGWTILRGEPYHH